MMRVKLLQLMAFMLNTKSLTGFMLRTLYRPHFSIIPESHE